LREKEEEENGGPGLLCLSISYFRELRGGTGEEKKRKSLRKRKYSLKKNRREAWARLSAVLSAEGKKEKRKAMLDPRNSRKRQERGDNGSMAEMHESNKTDKEEKKKKKRAVFFLSLIRGRGGKREGVGELEL